MSDRTKKQMALWLRALSDRLDPPLSVPFCGCWFTEESRVLPNGCRYWPPGCYVVGGRR